LWKPNFQQHSISSTSSRSVPICFIGKVCEPHTSLTHSLWCRWRYPSAQSTAPRPQAATSSLFPHPLLQPGRLSLQFRNEENSLNSETRKLFLFRNGDFFQFRNGESCFNSETGKVDGCCQHRQPLPSTFSHPLPAPGAPPWTSCQLTLSSSRQDGKVGRPRCLYENSPFRTSIVN